MALFGMDTTIGGNKIGFNPLNPYEHLEDAAKAQEDFINRGTAEHVKGINEALDEYRKQLGLAVEGLDPYTEFGRMSIDSLTSLLTDPSSIRDLPAYEFSFQEGQRALERRLPRGLDESGRLAKEMTRYGTDYASTKYGDRLSGLLGLRTVP